MITIPPPGWIDAGHLHGVPVLGTFITEWDAGKASCTALLANQKTWERAADQLAMLAKVLNFDGWIINIENNLPHKYGERMAWFLKRLACAMHAAVPGSKVIWYDAVTRDGELDWQDELNHKNSIFFEACDGIW